MLGMTHSGSCGCGCGGGCECDEACECGPAEFVRLRYYYGQRLGVVDFHDAQAYALGKQRFHNRRTHGAGVLCGLEATRFRVSADDAADAPTTLLRIARGAALDARGREVIVPVDHCIDVAAWFARNRGKPELAGWTPAEPRDLWVALRYRDCPSDPTPAPRDPCGCDAAGCEFGRIREGFELVLLPEAPNCQTASFPAANELRAAIDDAARDAPDGSTADRLRRRFAALLAAGCPGAPPDAWICLATLRVTLEAGQGGAADRVVDLTESDNAFTGRGSLLSTAALQTLLTEVLAVVLDEGRIGDGPRWGAIAFEPGVDATSGDLRIGVALAEVGDPAAAVPLAAGTIVPDLVAVRRFDGSQWLDAGPDTVAYDPDLGLVLGWGSGLDAGLYRLSIESPAESPIVDARLNPIRPARFARNFRLEASAGTLQLAESPF